MHRAAAAAAVLVALANGAAVAAPDASVTASKPVPESLIAVESSAEDLVDVALARDRAGVASEARVLQSAVRGPAASALTAAGASAAEIAELRRRAARVSGLAGAGRFTAVALAANGVSGLMPSLYAHFDDPVPPSVLMLDYLDREAQLRSLAGQRGRIPPIVARLQSTWSALRPRVVAVGGGREAGAFERHVASMKRLTHAAGTRLRSEAVNGLNLVDEIEAVFQR